METNTLTLLLARLDSILTVGPHYRPDAAAELAERIVEALAHTAGPIPSVTAETFDKAYRYVVEYVHPYPDEFFTRAAHAAGLDPNDLFRAEDIEDSGYAVVILYGGAFEDECVVFASFNDAAVLARQIVEEGQDPELSACVSDVAVGPGYQESQGYGPYGTFTWNEDTGRVEER